MNPLLKICLTAPILYYSAAAFASRPALIYLIPHNAGKLPYANESISDYCERNKSETFVKCTDDDVTWSLNAYEAPKETSKKLGEIAIRFQKNGLIEAAFIATDGAKTPFPAELSEVDYGHFDFTVTEQQGDWVQLPKRPFKTPVWINTARDWKESDIKKRLRPIKTGVVVSSAKLGDIVLTEIGETETSYRSESLSDSCLHKSAEGETKPKKFKIRKIKTKDLYDSDRHLLIRKKYSKGC